MDGCRVIFTIPGKDNTTWAEGYEGAEDVEIKELMVECAIALASLQDELSRRLGGEKSEKAREKERKDSEQLKYCQDNLDKTARRIKSENLSKHDLKQLTNEPTDTDRSLEVIKVGLGHMLRKSRASWFSHAYDEFLWLVSTVVSSEYALLVKCSFGKNRVDILDFVQKAKFIQYVKKKRNELFCDALRKEATRLGLSVDGM
jgi:hypothetical protein